MPGMDGHEVLRRIKDHPDWRATPVIVISGNQDMDGIIECIEAGADDYIAKPFSLEELLAREADDRDRLLPLVCEVLDELEKRRLGPVDVVEHEDKRPLASTRLAELTEEPGELGCGRRRLGGLLGLRLRIG